MKLGRNIRHISEDCRKCFQGQRSKVKVMTPSECYNGGGMHFDGVESRQSCFSSSTVTIPAFSFLCCTSQPNSLS